MCFVFEENMKFQAIYIAFLIAEVFYSIVSAMLRIWTEQDMNLTKLMLDDRLPPHSHENFIDILSVHMFIHLYVYTYLSNTGGPKSYL